MLAHLWRWGRQACLSLSGLLRRDAGAADCADDHLIYRVKRWPKLPAEGMTTDISRTLSVMSTRPVYRR